MRELGAGEVRQMTPDEAQTRLRDLREELFTLRFRNVMRQADNPLRIRAVRRAIARIETILGEDAHGTRRMAGAATAKTAAPAKTATAAPAKTATAATAKTSGAATAKKSGAAPAKKSAVATAKK